MSDRLRLSSVIFDLDGTLVDSLVAIQAASEAAVHELLPHLTVPDLRPYIGPPLYYILKNSLPGLEPQTLDQLCLAFRRHYDGGLWLRAYPYEGVPEIMEYLHSRKIPKFVVTNKPKIPTQRLLEQFKLNYAIKGVVSPDSRDPLFPNKEEMALECVRTYGLDPNTTLVVGDSIEDARMAHACGARFAAATYGYGKPLGQTECPVHYRINNMHELLHLVRASDLNARETI